LALPPAKEERPMRDLPDVKVFPNSLIDDMHKSFETVCGIAPLNVEIGEAALPA
jgi:hypothetical protein